MDSEFTHEQLLDWASYEEVRRSGYYNMLTYQARLSTGLNQEQYQFCMENYDKLRKSYEHFEDLHYEDFFERYADADNSDFSDSR